MIASNTQKQEIVSPQEVEALLRSGHTPKRILLVDGNLPVEGDVPYSFGDKKSSGVTPFGLKRIESYLSAKGVPSEVKHIAEINQDELSQYDIIGFSTLTPSIPQTLEFAKRTKQRYPDKLVIGGGEHFGLDYQWILENQATTGIDACCTMQGELPLLALSLGVPVQKIGSMSYNEKGKIVNNIRYPRLTESQGLESVLSPSPVINKELEPIAMPEVAPFFKGSGSTQTSSGCNYACSFCTNGPFYGKAVSTMKTAVKEIDSMQKSGVDFFFVRDPMLNVNSEHLQDFVSHMKRVNGKENKMAWYSFMSANKVPVNFEEMARAGALMIGVGLEDIVGDRQELGKGGDLSQATEFIDKAKEHLLVRTLLILGLPNHYQVPKEEIKTRMLGYMKSHPQAIYRINILTPTPGTADYKSYADSMTENPHQNPAFFKKLDNMHSVIDPKKMRSSLGTTDLNQNPNYVQTAQEWSELREEIMASYLGSKEHRGFLETLKGKEFLGRKDLLYDIAKKFREEITHGN
jgi:radical SAM superfamily enzyme YgiQ (UPF0313 family)